MFVGCTSPCVRMLSFKRARKQFHTDVSKTVKVCKSRIDAKSTAFYSDLRNLKYVRMEEVSEISRIILQYDTDSKFSSASTPS